MSSFKTLSDIMYENFGIRNATIILEFLDAHYRNFSHNSEKSGFSIEYIEKYEEKDGVDFTWCVAGKGWNAVFVQYEQKSDSYRIALRNVDNQDAFIEQLRDIMPKKPEADVNLDMSGLNLNDQEKSQLKNYIKYGEKPDNSFLVNVISGNIFQILKTNAEHDMSDITSLAQFLIDNAPEDSYGSAYNLDDWNRYGGLRGVAYFEKIHSGLGDSYSLPNKDSVLNM